MKTLLFPTDFSANAIHAAEYGYNLAKQIGANIILCNAIIIPSEVPEASMVVWPLEEYEVLIADGAEELKQLKEHLEQDSRMPNGFQPKVSSLTKSGVVTEVVKNIGISDKVDLVVIGTNTDSGLNALTLGDHSRKMINDATKSLLLVPPSAQITTVKKIGFAIDFDNTASDVDAISELISWARPLNIELLVIHISKGENNSPKSADWIKQFLAELTDKTGYSNIRYKFIENVQTEPVLDEICKTEQLDMLAMIHRHHGFFDTLVNGSYTQKMASQTTVPLLVFQASPLKHG
jgi:nucleotide-binding universal stress UspA family protein